MIHVPFRYIEYHNTLSIHEFRTLLTKINAKINANLSSSKSPFFDILLPSEQQQKQHSNNDDSTTISLSALLNEMRDVIDSNDFRTVFSRCLDVIEDVLLAQLDFSQPFALLIPEIDNKVKMVFDPSPNNPCLRSLADLPSLDQLSTIIHKVQP